MDKSIYKVFQEGDRCNAELTGFVSETDYPRYCPKCGVDRNILRDMYLSHNRERKADAREIMLNCHLCRDVVIRSLEEL